MRVSQGLPSPVISSSKSAPKTFADWSHRILLALSAMAVVGVIIGLYFGLVYAGADTQQGNVQRVFYFHVAAFGGATIAFAAAVLGGIAYLRTRRTMWDRLSLAGVEVGFFLALITLITGMVWARPIWNSWWTWDPRLTLMAIMMLTYAAYFMLRGAFEPGDKQRTMSAVYSILAFITVILVLIIIRVRPDTIHPAVIGSSPQNAQGGFAMTDSMRSALGINSFIWSCLVTPALLWWRIRLASMHEQIAHLRANLD